MIFLYFKNNKILKTIIFFKILSDLAFAKGQTLFLLSKIIFSLKQSLAIKLLR